MNTRKFLVLLLLVVFLSNCDEKEKKHPLKCCLGDNDKEIICLVTSMDTIAADGVTRVQLTACTPDVENKVITSITFNTPDKAGSFVAEGAGNQIVKNIDENGAATAILTCGTTPGVYTIVVTVNYDDKSYSDEIRLTELALAEDVISIIEDSTVSNMKADGSSIYKWRLKIDNISLDGKMVSISKSGPFQFLHQPDDPQTSLPLDQQGKVTFDMQSSRSPGNASLSFSVDNFTLSKNYTITNAYPDQIRILSSKPTLKPSIDSVVIDTYLDRNIGMVSEGIDLYFKAFQLVNQDTLRLGEFIPPFSNTIANASNMPNASVLFRTRAVDIIDTSEPIIIIGSVLSSNEMIIQDKIVLPVD